MDKKLGLEEKDSSRNTTLHHHEIVACRGIFHKYITSPSHHQDHQSIAGEPLDKELKDIITHGEKNYRIYVKDLCEGRGYGHTKLTPSFTLTANRDAFEAIVNKTKAQIHDLILGMVDELRELGDEDEANQLLVQLFHTKLHEEYVELFEEVQDTLSTLKSCFYTHRSSKLN